MCRGDTFADAQEDYDDDYAGDNDPVGHVQENTGDGTVLDGEGQDSAAVQDFFSSDQANRTSIREMAITATMTTLVEVGGRGYRCRCGLKHRR